MPVTLEGAGAPARAPRRRRLLAGALLAGLAGTLLTPAEGAEPRTAPVKSGLPWASGAFIDKGPLKAGFTAWRHNRAPDVETAFFGLQTWRHMGTSAATLRWKLPATANRLIVALGMLPKSHEGQLAQCSAGQFDPHIQAIAAAMLNNGAQGAADAGKPVIVRLGWEANNANGSYPWRAVGDGITWRDCFRRRVDILNPVANGTRQKRFVIVWNMANRGDFAHPIENLWPGNDYVDIVGSQYYDRCPPLPGPNADPKLDGDREWWFKRVNARAENGNPAGPGAWLEFARSKGKPYAIPEWGVGGLRNVCAAPGTDNPYFIHQMYRFLWWNAADIAFGSYFNGHGYADDTLGTHKLFAPDPTYNGLSFRSASDTTYLSHAQRYNPLAAAEYRRLWGAAAEPPRPLEPPPPPPPPAPGPEDTLYWLRYIATYNDTVRSLGTDAARGYEHHQVTGQAAGRLAWFDPAAYFARYPAYRNQLRGDLAAGTRHFINVGYARGFTWSNGPLYWLRYTASNPDLIPQLGVLPTAAEAHWHERGKAEGRKVTFNLATYLSANAAARAACGTNQTCATKHLVENAGR